MLTSAALSTCQIPWRSGLPSGVRGGAYAPSRRTAARTATANTAPITPAISERTITLLGRRVGRRPGPRTARKQLAPVWQRHGLRVGDLPAVLREERDHRHLRAHRHRAAR